MSLPTQRPAVVTGIGWTFIASAVILLLLGLMSLGAGGMMLQMMAQNPRMPDDFPWQFRMMFGLVEYFAVVAWGQIALSVVALVAGIQFLRCRAWARAALEALTWLALVATLGIGALWLWGWLSLSGPSGAPGMPISVGIKAVGVVMLAVIVVVCAVPLLLLIRYLRRPVVRQAMR